MRERKEMRKNWTCNVNRYLSSLFVIGIGSLFTAGRIDTRKRWSWDADTNSKGNRCVGLVVCLPHCLSVWHLFIHSLLQLVSQTVVGQSASQNPQASWSAGGHWESLWGNGIVTAGILWLTVLSFVTVNSQSEKSKFFPFSQSLSRQPPAEQEAKGPGYETGQSVSCVVFGIRDLKQRRRQRKGVRHVNCVFRFVSFYFAIIPSCLTWLTCPNYPGTEFVGTALKFR